MAFSNDTKPSESSPTVVGGGDPIGLLLSLTYAGTVVPGGYVNDSEPSAVSYSNDIKP